MGHEAIAANIRRLRKGQGLSQAKLAEAAGLSLAGYRNIETRRSVPRVDTLSALAGALEVPIQDLVTPVPELRAVRFRSFKRLRARESVVSDVARRSLGKRPSRTHPVSTWGDPEQDPEQVKDCRKE